MSALADIADQLKEARRQAGLTQQQLADRAGHTRTLEDILAEQRAGDRHLV